MVINGITLQDRQRKVIMQALREFADEATARGERATGEAAQELYLDALAAREALKIVAMGE